jgi:hypothetical protein
MSDMNAFDIFQNISKNGNSLLMAHLYLSLQCSQEVAFIFSKNVMQLSCQIVLF